ncbi:phosphoglycerate mutase, partial [Streptomyces sp. SID8455]|nr:phosphoglycerate mutase [Streptomyces sp. SID8455]
LAPREQPVGADAVPSGGGDGTSDAAVGGGGGAP